VTTSRIPAIIDALISTLNTGLPGVTVLDGPMVTVPDNDYVTVGWEPNNTSTPSKQKWVGVGPSKARQEDIDIPCYCSSFSGSVSMSDRRNDAFTLLAAVEDALRADPFLGGAVTQPGYAEMGSIELFETQGKAGADVGIAFHVTVTTRI
jgi:hypothetical protein